MSEDLYEAVTELEEVASSEEAVVSVDLTTVSQQLDQVISWQKVQFGLLAVLIGVILGVTFGKLVGKVWR